MKEQMKLINRYIIPLLLVCVMYSCSGPGGNNPGTEYMPDMGHSIAYEANLDDYYYYNTWGSEEEYYQMAKPRNPVANTIARSNVGVGKAYAASEASMQGYSVSGSVPYHYADTEEERTRASEEIISNPYPITNAGMARAKELYEVNCGICHGSKGDGEGWLVSEKNSKAVYPAQPAILISDEFISASNGRLYHAIMHGKNVMGGYADKLSYEERWQVIHYIRSLQAKEKKLAYDETENTLTSVALPLMAWKKSQEAAIIEDIEANSDMEIHIEKHDGGHHDHDAGH